MVPSDTIREYLLNEKAVLKLGFPSYKPAIGRSVIINGTEGKIAGVVKDFHTQSFHGEMDPVYITTKSDNYTRCAVKINLENLSTTMEILERIWNVIYPEYVFRYEFLNERIASFYQQDLLILRLIQVFSTIAILIGCLGLYGLVSFMSAQKTRKLGFERYWGRVI